MPVNFVFQQEAVEARSFLSPTRTVRVGDAEEALSHSDHIIEGSLRLGGQAHFYLETQTCVVLPQKEDDEIVVYASSQNPMGVQVRGISLSVQCARKWTTGV